MKIGFIGCGRMAEAILSSFINSRIAGPHELFASDVSVDRRRTVKGLYGINMYTRNDIIPDMSNLIFLAVKPQNLNQALKDIADQVTSSHLIISIVAGKTLDYLESMLPLARVIRVMPNLPCIVGEGMSVFCAGRRSTPADQSSALKLMGSFGKVLELPEDSFDAVTAVSGSGPAFYSYFMARIVAAGVKAGLNKKDASLLAEQTMLGTSRLLIEQRISPDDLMKSVASAKGTTAAGLAVLKKSDLGKIANETISAAAKRSKELSA